MELKEAYQIVFNDMMENGSILFQGVYDAKNGTDVFMFGLKTPLEYIADKAGHGDEFCDMFIKNMIDSEDFI